MSDSERVGEEHVETLRQPFHQVTEDSRDGLRQEYPAGKERIPRRPQVFTREVLHSRGSRTDRREDALTGECRWCLERDRCLDGTVCHSHYQKYLRMCEYIHNHMN